MHGGSQSLTRFALVSRADGSLGPLQLPASGHFWRSVGRKALGKRTPGLSVPIWKRTHRRGVLVSPSSTRWQNTPPHPRLLPLLSYTLPFPAPTPYFRSRHARRTAGAVWRAGRATLAVAKKSSIPSGREARSVRRRLSPPPRGDRRGL